MTKVAKKSPFPHVSIKFCSPERKITNIAKWYINSWLHIG